MRARRFALLLIAAAALVCAASAGAQAQKAFSRGNSSMAVRPTGPAPMRGNGGYHGGGWHRGWGGPGVVVVLPPGGGQFIDVGLVRIARPK